MKVSGRKDEMRRRLRDELEEREELTEGEIADLIDELILDEGSRERLSLREKEELQKELLFSVRKLDVLQELVDDPEVTEIMVNGFRHIFYEKDGKIRRWEREFPSPERLEDVVQLLFRQCLLL